MPHLCPVYSKGGYISYGTSRWGFPLDFRGDALGEIARRVIASIIERPIMSLLPSGVTSLNCLSILRALTATEREFSGKKAHKLTPRPSAKRP